MRNLDKPTWHTPDTAEYLDTSEGAVRNLVMRRKIPFRKVAGRLIFLPDEIKAWVQNSPGLRLEDID